MKILLLDGSEKKSTQHCDQKKYTEARCPFKRGKFGIGNARLKMTGAKMLDEFSPDYEYNDNTRI